MKQGQESFKIIHDCKHRSIERFVCKGLNIGRKWLKGQWRDTIGFVLNGRLIGGVIFHDLTPNHEVWLTIYTINKRWCSRGSLRVIFDIAFDILNVKRVSALVDTDNDQSAHLCERIGFVKEGKIRECRENGKDCFMFGMLKNERKF